MNKEETKNYINSMIKHGYFNAELFEQVLCKCIICEQGANVAFNPCGHMSCVSCSNKLETCHICRSSISNKIKIYLNE